MIQKHHNISMYVVLFSFERYRFAFNGKENDDETYGGGNEYDYGDRIYDTRLGKWLSIDPLQKEYPDLSPYSGMGDNPIFLIDIDGRQIVVYSKANQQVVLKMINAKALGTFAFKQNGELYLKSNKGNGSKYSEYYRDRLVEAIKDKDLIVISKSETFIDDEGKTQKTDDPVKGGGGGVTIIQEFKTTDIKTGVTNSEKVAEVTISGNANSKDIQDPKGNIITVSPEEILMHELVGHAIPFTVKTDTGNAVKNDNKARSQTGDPQRKSSPAHVE